MWFYLFHKMGKKKYIQLVAFLVIFSPLVQASHIIGGDFSYRFLQMDGPDLYRYQITLTIYRDCGSPDHPAFDNPAYIGIFLMDTDSSLTFLEEIQVLPGPIETISYVDNPCLEENDNICIEESSYVFEKVFKMIPQDYFISYQRCCRNQGVSNLPRGSQYGATYSISLSPASLVHQNSSPRFKPLNEYVICAGAPYSLNFSAIDPDGDSLVYNFCTPYTGGGLQFINETIFNCDGLTPKPSICTPELIPIQFTRSGSYQFSAFKPAFGHPEVNGKTGILSGSKTPRDINFISGIYLITVCVSEYRNSQLLSTARKEFQFHSVPCVPKPQSKTVSSYVENGLSTLLLCTDNHFVLANNSGPEENIFTYDWNIFYQDEELHFNVREPVISADFLNPSDTLFAHLVLNKGLLCGDSVDLLIIKHPELTADFLFTIDSCANKPAQFISQSHTADPKGIDNYLWKDGNTVISSQSQFEVEFAEWRYHDIYHIVEDFNGCRDTTSLSIPYFPVPDTLWGFDSLSGCGEIEYRNNNLLELGFSDAYLLDWDFMHGSPSKNASVSHLFDQPGEFEVNLFIESPLGCQYMQKMAYIRVYENQSYHIVGSKPKIMVGDPEASFWPDLSDYEQVQWTLDGVYQTDRDTFNYIFNHPGQYILEMEVWNGTCTYQVSSEINVYPEDLIFLPNVFTPNSDGVNDYYMGEGLQEFIQSYEMTIWDRWGQLLFFTSDPNTGWNGKVNQNGQTAAQGVYICQLVIKDIFDKTHIYHQTVTLVR